MGNYILNPDIKIIPNKTRNILYRIDNFFHSPDKIAPIAPADSIFLLLFDGTRNNEEVRRDYLRVFEERIVSSCFTSALFSFIGKKKIKIAKMLMLIELSIC